MDGMDNAKNYLKNIKASSGRTLRIEMVGEVSPEERHFLDGCALFIAGTLRKEDNHHTAYVSQQMGKLVKQIMARLRKELEG